MHNLITPGNYKKVKHKGLVVLFEMTHNYFPLVTYCGVHKGFFILCNFIYLSLTDLQKVVQKHL